MRVKFWIILSCYHWYKWDGENNVPDVMKCPTCGLMGDVLDKVPVTVQP